MDIIETIKSQITGVIGNACAVLEDRGEFRFEPGFLIPIEIETPKEKQNGDFSSNIAMKITKMVKKPPQVTAKLLAEQFDLSGTYIERAEIAGPGFLNFYLKRDWLYDALAGILSEGAEFGKINIGGGQKVVVEFVSANPTGPMHMGNARGGVIGDVLANILKHAGYDVTKEFYVNDAGAQIEKFGKSLEARYIQQLKGQDAVEFPEDGYQGEDITEHARAYIAQFGDKLLEQDSDARRRALIAYALPINLAAMKAGLANYNISYDEWFFESTLHKNGELEDTISLLKEKGLTYEKDGALWLKATEFGCEKDEVLIRQNGIPTYFAADIAYHRNKFSIRGFSRAINIWGADHHGHVARLKNVLTALGLPGDQLEIILMQLVRLMRDGEVARMSKRTGKMITLSDLIDEIGVDAARFFFNLRHAESHLDFDLDLAVAQNSDNPVFYVQYAHARICSILRTLKAEGVELGAPEDVDLTVLTQPEELDLIAKLAAFPQEIAISAKTTDPSRITRYVLDVAALFHSFYNAPGCRVKGGDDALTRARLALVSAARTVIQNVLHLLGITAPETM